MWVYRDFTPLKIVSAKVAEWVAFVKASGLFPLFLIALEKSNILMYDEILLTNY